MIRLTKNLRTDAAPVPQEMPALERSTRQIAHRQLDCWPTPSQVNRRKAPITPASSFDARPGRHPPTPRPPLDPAPRPAALTCCGLTWEQLGRRPRSRSFGVLMTRLFRHPPRTPGSKRTWRYRRSEVRIRPAIFQNGIMKALSVLTVSAVARRNDEVLLVRHGNAGDLASEWDLPGGMVEDGELADDALRREIWEETGLQADLPSRLLSIVQFRNPDAPPPGLLTAMYFEVAGLRGEILCQDPDGDVVQAEWVAIPDAIARLSAGHAAHMRDPALHCLTGQAPEATFWTWPNGLGEEPRVIPPIS